MYISARKLTRLIISLPSSKETLTRLSILRLKLENLSSRPTSHHEITFRGKKYKRPGYAAQTSVPSSNTRLHTLPLEHLVSFRKKSTSHFHISYPSQQQRYQGHIHTSARCITSPPQFWPLRPSAFPQHWEPLVRTPQNVPVVQEVLAILTPSPRKMTWQAPRRLGTTPFRGPLVVSHSYIHPTPYIYRIDSRIGFPHV